MAITRVTPEMTTFGEASDAALALLLAPNSETDGEGLRAIGDVPDSYAGKAGLGLVVNGDEDGIEFVALSGGGVATFVGLTDGPMAWAAHGQILEIAPDGLSLQWRDPPADPKCYFTELDDTPSSYTGQDGKILMVDPEGDEALVFTQLPPAGAVVFTGLNDTPDIFGDPGEILVVDDDRRGLVWAPYPTGGSGSTSTFIGLSDTPETFTPGAVLRGKINGDPGLEWHIPLASSSTSFVGLTDTPQEALSTAANQSVRVNSGGTALEYYTPVSTLSLTQLTDDMPATLGAAGEILVMNGTGDALEFQAASGTVADWVDLGDTTGPIGSNGQVVTVVAGKLECEDLPSIPTSLTEFYPEFPVAFAGSAGMAVAVNGAGDGLEFVEFPSGGGGTTTGTTTPAPVMLAITDEATVFGTGTDVVKFRAPYDITIGSVKASLTTASSSGLVTVDIKINGTSIFTTDFLTIDATETTSATATTAPNITSTTISDDDEITIDISGAGTNATGLKVSIIAA